MTTKKFIYLLIPSSFSVLNFTGIFLFMQLPHLFADPRSVCRVFGNLDYNSGGSDTVGFV